MSDAAALLAAYDEQVRTAEGVGLPPHAHVERLGPVLRVTGLHRGFVSTDRDLGRGGAALDALIAEHRDFFAARGEAFEWKTRAHDLPAELPDRLVAAGFEPEERETVVVAPVGDVLAAIGDVVLPDGVRVHEVTRRQDMDRIARMEAAVWGRDESWLADELHAMTSADPRLTHVFVADGEGPDVLSAAWLTLTPGTQFAGLWGGSTLEAWRGRGLYRSIVAARARLAAARGVRYLQVDASDDSRPILERLGFVAVTTTTPYVWSPTAEPGLDA